MIKENKIVTNYKGYTIAKSGNMYSIFTSDLVNATQPLYTYFTSVEECKQFIDNF